METSSLRSRAAFVEASEFVLEVIDAVEDPQWELPGLGMWTVRELAVHTSRAWTTLILYAGRTGEVTIHSSVEYFVAALSSGPDVHDQVAQRSREQAASLAEPVSQDAHRLFREAENVLERTPADQVMATFAGGIRLVDYLPTRVVELVVHGIDLCAAVGRSPAVPVGAMELTLEVLVDLATERPAILDPADLVRALTGRAPLPGEFNVLA